MNKLRAQSSIEFSVAFVSTLLFLVLTVNLFVWFNHCIVRRQRAFEDTRTPAGGLWVPKQDEGSIEKREKNIGKSDFYPQPPRLNVFSLGGYDAKAKK